MRITINTTVRLTYGTDDTIKIVVYYTDIFGFEILKYETKEMNFFTGINLIQSIENVKDIEEVDIYISKSGITHKFKFNRGFEHERVETGNSNFTVNVSVIDGTHRPSVMVNDYGPIDHDFLPTVHCWSCLYCGAANALDKVGTPDECCVLL